MPSFPSKSSVEAVFAFNRLPETPEKREIERKYMNDEISAYEFAGMARTYVAKETNQRRVK